MPGAAAGGVVRDGRRGAGAGGGPERRRERGRRHGPRRRGGRTGRRRRWGAWPRRGSGAGAGLLLGSAAGANAAQASAANVQRGYDIAYAQCMAAAGESVPHPNANYAPAVYGYAYPPPVVAYGAPVVYAPPVVVGYGLGPRWRRWWW